MVKLPGLAFDYVTALCEGPSFWQTLAGSRAYMNPEFTIYIGQ